MSGHHPATVRLASGFMQLREITGKRMIITHLSNHTLVVIITVHDISHLGVKITSFVISECINHTHSPEKYHTLKESWTLSRTCVRLPACGKQSSSGVRFST